MKYSVKHFDRFEIVFFKKELGMSVTGTSTGFSLQTCFVYIYHIKKNKTIIAEIAFYDDHHFFNSPDKDTAIENLIKYQLSYMTTHIKTPHDQKIVADLIRSVPKQKQYC